MSGSGECRPGDHLGYEGGVLILAESKIHAIEVVDEPRVKSHRAAALGRYVRTTAEMKPAS